MSQALKLGTYELVQKASGVDEENKLKGQEIAIEVKMGDESLGFMSYDKESDTWSIVNKGAKSMSGYKGKTGDLIENTLV